MAKLVESHGTQYMAAAVILSGTECNARQYLHCLESEGGKDNEFNSCFHFNRDDGVFVWVLEIRESCLCCNRAGYLRIFKCVCTILD